MQDRVRGRSILEAILAITILVGQVLYSTMKRGGGICCNMICRRIVVGVWVFDTDQDPLGVEATFVTPRRNIMSRVCIWFQTSRRRYGTLVANIEKRKSRQNQLVTGT